MSLKALLADYSCYLVYTEEGLERFVRNAALDAVQDDEFQALLGAYRQATERLAAYVDTNLPLEPPKTP